jgi:hypothetical protein
VTDETVGFRAAEEFLLCAEFQDCKPIWHSSNYVYLAQLEIEDGQTFAAIYKPHRGESPLWDFPEGLYQREVATYRFSQLIGWPFIPPTVVRDGPQGIGSLQVFIRHDETSHYFEQRENPDLVGQLQRIAVFDFIANNADRKGGHCLLDSDGRIWGIDHGLCFHEQYKMRTVIWDWSEQPIPDEWLDEMRAVRTKLTDATEDALRFAELLSPAEILATIRRIDLLVADPRFPKPGPHRSYPWPLV